MQSSSSSSPPSLAGLAPGAATGPGHGWWRPLVFSVVRPVLGRGLWASLQEMERVQWSSPMELERRAEARLARLLTHATRSVPFYEPFARRGAAPGPDAFSALTAFPVLRKSEYRAEPLERFLSTAVGPERRLTWITSGSTGEPFHFCLDRDAMPLVFASHLFYDSWWGLRPFDRYVRIVMPPSAPPTLAASASLPARLRNAFVNYLKTFYERWTQRHIHVSAVEPATVEDIRRQIEAFRPDFLLGYTSTLALIGDELLRRNLPLSRPLRGVITIAETLTPLRRQLITRYFAAPIINRYGLREFGAWSAQSCPESPDSFHVNTEMAICEVLREDGTPAEPGETGRIVLTDLHNYAMPFIRYDTGDLAVVASRSCDCGRGLPLLGEIQGRSLECVRTRAGRVINPTVLGRYLREGGPLFQYSDHLVHIRHYQLVQESPDQVRLLVVPDGAFDQGCRDRLHSDLQQLLGDDVRLMLECVSEIRPERSGKRPLIKLAKRTGTPADGAPPDGWQEAP